MGGVEVFLCTFSRFSFSLRAFFSLSHYLYIKKEKIL
nr:MAG TPA: hypothetical protein [Caudoviricetes sp.]